jgi:two-component sensor histidine kinase
MAKNSKQELDEAEVANAGLLHELNHRVKNNLQIMESLVRLQLATILDPDLRKAFLSTQRRLHALNASNEILLDRLEAKRLDLFSIMQSLTKELIHTFDPESRDVGVTLSGERIDVGPEFIVPLGVITDEILANALDNARSGADRVRMEISWAVEAGGEVSMTYRDVGGGFPEKDVGRLRETLDMLLGRILSEQIRATFTISNDVAGVVTVISLSEARPRSP